MNSLAFGALWLAVGLVLGAAYFMALRWNAMLLARVGGPSLFALVLPFGRLVLIALCLAAIAMRFGAMPLLAAALGIFLARMVLVRKEQTPQ